MTHATKLKGLAQRYAELEARVQQRRVAIRRVWPELVQRQLERLAAELVAAGAPRAEVSPTPKGELRVAVGTASLREPLATLTIGFDDAGFLCFAGVGHQGTPVYGLRRLDPTDTPMPLSEVLAEFIEAALPSSAAATDAPPERF